jgi:ABC-type branched-subunit amino acid transport system substrate-binding protein
MGRIGVVLWMVMAFPAWSGENGEPAEDAILLGMSTALSGPALFLGVNMHAGVMAAIEEANQSGGIQGKPLRLICLDDGYEPARAAPNMRRLIDEYKVLTVIGNVGTPTAVAAIPIANASKTPFFGAFTGAGILRKNPPDRYVINYRASYAQEVAAMIRGLIVFGGLKPNEIGFFTQRDTYGDAGFIGGIEALKDHGLTDENDIIHSRYERNTLAVENGLADIILAEHPPRAVIMVGAYGPCAEFIRLAQESHFKAIFLNVSFVGTAPLSQSLGTEGDGVIITQVVPHYHSDLPLVREYREALRAYDPHAEYSFVSLEGYIVVRILRRALERIEGGFTRDAVVDALENIGEFDIGLGEKLKIGADSHQACYRVWPTILKNGQAVPFQWEQLAEIRGEGK